MAATEKLGRRLKAQSNKSGDLHEKNINPRENGLLILDNMQKIRTVLIIVQFIFFYII